MRVFFVGLLACLLIQSSALCAPPDDEALRQSLIGTRVTGPAGENLGEVSSVIVEDGKIVSVVIALGGFLGIGEKLVAVDRSIVEIVIKNGQPAVSMQGLDRNVLESLPEYRPDEPRVSFHKTNVCAERNICTPVRIFFGTNRNRVDSPERVAFGAERARRLQLGVAVVTVPRSGRKVGEVNLPSWWDRWVKRIPAGGDLARHFTIPNGGINVFDSVEEFVASVREEMAGGADFKDHAVVFVHGFNVTFDEALFRSAQITYDLGTDETPFGTVLLYSWPSGGVLSGYKYDAESAAFSITHLRGFFDIVREKTGAKNIHVIAHSMGNDPVLRTLDEMAKAGTGTTTFNQVILASPDFDAAEFAEVTRRVLPIAQGVTIYASSKDVAMEAARRAHLSHRRAGDVPSDGPVVVEGADTVDVSAMSTAVFGLKHSEYAERKELLNDLAILMRAGTRPPSARNINYKKREVSKGAYWIYAE